MKQSFSIDSSPKKHVLDSIIHTKVTETLTVRGPELSNVLEDLRNQGVSLLAVSVMCTSDWSVTFQRNNFSAIPLKPNEEKNE